MTIVEGLLTIYVLIFFICLGIVASRTYERKTSPKFAGILVSLTIWAGILIGIGKWVFE